MMAESQMVQSLLEEVRTATPDAIQLARIVCLATRVEPELLRYARLELLPDVDAGAEADLWFSPLVESYSSMAAVLMPEIAALLRNELAKDQQLLDAAWHIVRALHATAPPAIRLEEEVTYLSLSSRPDARMQLEHRLLSALHAIVEEQRSGLIQWVVRALPRLPEAARHSEATWMLAFVAGTALGGRQILEGEVPPNAVGEWLPQILPMDTPRVSISVRLIEGGVEVSTHTLDEAHQIEIPRTNPLLLVIARTEDEHERIQQIVVTEGQTQYVGVGGDTVIIQTALGERYRIRPQSQTRYVDLDAGASTTALRSNSTQVEEPHVLSQDQRYRRAMLDKVRSIWISGVLKQSLIAQTSIALGLVEQPDNVTRPTDVLIQSGQRDHQPLPPNTPIEQVYDDLSGELLILGAPGAGKTMLLLELMEALLQRARRQPDHPIPVVFSLSSWAAQRRPLAEWLVDELAQRYDLSRNVGRPWVAANQILPLLDGLDEVADQYRNACVQAINTFRQGRALLPLVITSRIDEYEAVASRLQLHGAIVIQPLNHEQARRYLRAVGVTTIPPRDSSLWELLDTPLMLTIAALTYRGQPLDVGSDPITMRGRLLTAYVDRMLERSSSNTPYTRAQVMRGLTWLAQELTAQNIVVFKPGALGIVRRFSLTRSGDLPWNNRAFLDYAAQRILLRRVGDGYMFIHRLLQDYFASLDPK